MIVGCDVNAPSTSAEAVQLTTCSAGCLVSPRAPAGSPDSFTAWDTATLLDGSAGVTWEGGVWTVTIPVVAGDQVSSIVVPVRDNGPSDLSVVTASLISKIGSTATTLGSVTSQGDGQIEPVTITVPTRTVATGETLTVTFSCMTQGINPIPSASMALAGTLQVSPAAQTHPANVSTTVVLPLAAAFARATGSTPAAILQGVSGWLVNSTGELVYELPVRSGDVITGFRVFGNKQSSSTTRLAATVMSVHSSNGVASGSFTQSNQQAAPGAFVLTATGGQISVTAGNSYIIEADSSSGLPQDMWYDAEVTVSRNQN